MSGPLDEDLTATLARIHAQSAATSAWVSTLTPAQASNIGQIGRTWPGIGGAAVPLGLAGLSPTSSAVQTAANAAAAQHVKKHWWQKAGSFVGSQLSNAWGATQDTLTDLSAPLQAMQFMFRTTYGAGREFATHGFGAADQYVQEHGSFGDLVHQTTAGAQFAQARAYDKAHGTSGIFGLPSNKAFDYGRATADLRQKQEARSAGLINGHAITPGRAWASLLPDFVAEPGSHAYKVISGATDADFALVADPVGHGLGKASATIKAAKQLDRGAAVVSKYGSRSVATAQKGAVATADHTGAVDGLRQTVLPEKAADWLDSAHANALAEKLAGATDFNTIWRGTGKKLPVDLVLKLQQAQDSTTVKNHLADAIADGVMRDSPVFKTRRVPPRIAGMMPGSSIDPENPDDAVEQLDRFMRNVRLPEEQISALNQKMAEAVTGKGSLRANNTLQAVETMLDATKRALIERGVRSDIATAATRAFHNDYAEMQKYAVNEIGENARVPWAKIGADNKPLPTPTLSAEMLQRSIPLPDARMLKRLATDHDILRKLNTSLPANVVRDLGDFVNGSIFKPFSLVLRPVSYGLRVVGEEQFRMGAAGLDSAFHHPLSYVATLAGAHPDGKLAKALTKAGQAPRLSQDLAGHAFDEHTAIADGITEYHKALNQGSAGWKDAPHIVARSMAAVGKDHPQYASGLAGELIQLAHDPVSRELARSDAATVRAMFWDGALSGERRNWDEALAARHANDPTAPRFDLSNKRNSDAFVDATLERLQTKTQGDSRLMDAVAHGRYEGHPLLARGRDGSMATNPAVVDAFRADPDLGPTMVKAKIMVAGDSTSGQRVLEHYDHGLEILFNALLSKPTNYLSRSVTFRQRYWQRAEELMPMMSAGDRAATIRAAKAAGVKKAAIERMRAIESADTPEGRLSTDLADHLSKKFALDQTRQLLYSLHERSQVFDALRMVFPFGEAWREVLTRWAKLAVENPKVLYRANQIYNAGTDSGFFHPDEQGNEAYSVPGMEWITKHLAGVPVNFTEKVSGLNMFGNIIPGVGPVVTMPAGAVLPKLPAWGGGPDAISKVLMPYGPPDTSGGVLEQFLPSYLQKIKTALGHGTPQQKRQLASATRDTMAYLYSTGKYDISTPDGQAHLLEDARSKAKALYLIRAMVQANTPSAPSPEFMAKDKDGRLTSLHMLADDYRKMQTADPKTAGQKFLEKYGDFAFLVTLPKTSGDLPATDTVHAIARQHPELADKFPKVFGLFAAASNNVDPNEVTRQVNSGERADIGPEGALQQANIRVASAIYAQAKAQVGDKPSPDQQEWLREVKAYLSQKYPGYTGIPAGLEKVPQAIQQLQAAVKDKTLGGTDAGQGLKLYLRARQQALDIARQRGLSTFGQANKAQDLRAWLRSYAQWAIEQHPDFEQMWDRVLSREMVSDDQPDGTPDTQLIDNLVGAA